MGIEDIEIRITKSGQIYVRIDGLSEQRVHDYRLFLQEQIGPIQSSEVDRKPDWERPAAYASEDELARQKRQDIQRG